MSNCSTCGDTRSVPGYKDEYCPVCKYTVAGIHGHGTPNTFRNACPDCTPTTIGEHPLTEIFRKYYKPIRVSDWEWLIK